MIMAVLFPRPLDIYLFSGCAFVGNNPRRGGNVSTHPLLFYLFKKRRVMRFPSFVSFGWQALPAFLSFVIDARGSCFPPLPFIPLVSFFFLFFLFCAFLLACPLLPLFVSFCRYLFCAAPPCLVPVLTFAWVVLLAFLLSGVCLPCHPAHVSCMYCGSSLDTVVVMVAAEMVAGDGVDDVGWFAALAWSAREDMLLL